MGNKFKRVKAAEMDWDFGNAIPWGKVKHYRRDYTTQWIRPCVSVPVTFKEIIFQLTLK